MDIVHIEVKGEPFLYQDIINETNAISNTDKDIVIEEGIEKTAGHIDPSDVCKTLSEVKAPNEYDCDIQEQYSVPVRQYRNKRKCSFHSETKNTFINNDVIKLKNHADNFSQQNIMSSLTVKQNEVIDLPLPDQGQSRFNQQECEYPYRLNKNRSINWKSHTSKLKSYNIHFPEKKLNSNSSSSSTETNSIQYTQEVEKSSNHDVKNKETRVLQTNISLGKSQICQSNPQTCASSEPLVQNEKISLILHSSAENHLSCNELDNDLTAHLPNCVTEHDGVGQLSDVNESFFETIEQELKVKHEQKITVKQYENKKRSNIGLDHKNNKNSKEIFTGISMLRKESTSNMSSLEVKQLECLEENGFSFNALPNVKTDEERFIEICELSELAKQGNENKKFLSSLENNKNVTEDNFTGRSMLNSVNTGNNSIMFPLEVKQIDCGNESDLSFNSLSNIMADVEQSVEKDDSSVIVRQDNMNRVFLSSLEKMQKDSDKISVLGNSFNVADRYFTTYSDFLLPTEQNQDGTLVSSGLENNQYSSNDQTVASQINSTFHINLCQSIRKPFQNKTLLNNVSRKIYILCPLKQNPNRCLFNQKTKLMPHNTLRVFLKSFANDKALPKVKQIGKRKSRNCEQIKKKGHSQAVNKKKILCHCVKCNKQVRGVYNFKKHLLKHENEGNFKCNKCNKFFKKMSTYKRHSSQTDCKKMFKCRRCHKKFNSNDKLKEHLRSVDEDQCTPSAEWEYYYCSTCYKGFPDKDKLRYHLELHNGVTHNCPKCGKSFNTKNRLRCHMKIHSSVKSLHLCHLCGKRLWSKVSLDKHLNIHKHSKSFQCSVCGILVSSEANLQRHSYIHSDEPQFQCAHCNQKFFQKQNLAYHLKTCNIPETVHNQYKKSTKFQKCLICNKLFYKLTRYIDHLNAHAGNKSKYSCPICNKSFTNKYYLPLHLKSHKGEKPLKCPICSRCFLLKSNFNRHLDIHSEEKKYSCNICKKRFSQEQGLVNHMNAHKGLKPYQCSTCNRQFLERGTLIRHLRIHFQKKLNQR